MKKIIKRAAVGGLVLALLTGSVLAAGNLTDATVKSYEDQLASIQAKKKEALSVLAQIEDQQNYTYSEMERLDEVIGYNNQLKNLAEGQLDTILKQIEEKEENIKNTEEKLAQQEQAFLDRMVQNYMEEDTDYIELILGAENLLDFLTRFERVKAVLEYDREIMANLKESKAALENEKKNLAKAKETQLDRVTTLENAISENNAIYQTKLAYIDRLNANQSEWSEAYAYNSQLEQKLNKELEEYLAELQRKSQAAYVGGDIGWPLELGTYYYVSSEQGWRNLWGVQDYHLGIDLACAAGTNIRASNAGTVLKSEYHYSYGNYVLIDHGGGIATLYAHMSERLVAAGQTVTAGQLIGYCGLTGNTSGYHLHFEVRKNGEVQNPRNYLVFP